jgi:hypothetical protein
MKLALKWFVRDCAARNARAAALLALAVCGAGVLLARRPALVRAKSGASLAAAPRSAAKEEAEAAASLSIQGEVLTLTSHGFEPNTLIRPHGQFVLIVQNRSLVESIDLALDRVAGARLRDVPVPRNKYDWNDLFDLTPGQYTLTEAGHPKWSCDITITP